MNRRSVTAAWWGAVGCAFLAWPSGAASQVEGILGVEGRSFVAAADSLARAEPSLVARVRHRFGPAGADVVLGGSIRLDPVNPGRNRFDPTDLALRVSAGAVDLTVGFHEAFWGVLERRNLVDVVNQRDPDMRWPRQHKLAQPTIAVSWNPGWSAVEFAVLPWARPRPFDGRRGRLWSATTVDRSARRYRGSLKHLAWATRWSFVAAAWDLAASYFEGTARDPRFEEAADGSRLVPVYDRVRQLGVDAQYTGSTWLWKLELATLDPTGGRYVAFGSGVEYAPLDYLSVYVECFFDSRNREATTSLEHDVFLGTRIYYQDGSVTGGASVDVTSGHVIGSIEIVRRIANDVLGLELRGFAGRAADEPPFAPREETTVSVFFRRHF